jgi:hypothetical protein|tara:strand:- start:50 stop:448 length:399 start_codon:yes stop_codon:yes gene_type:complete
MPIDDKEYSASDYLLGKVDPFDLYRSPPVSISNLLREPSKPTKPTDVVQSKSPVKVKPYARESKLQRARVNVANHDKKQMLAVQEEHVKNKKAYNIWQEARMLDNKIKRSKKPDYEDLKKFHDLSSLIEETL